jgi:serine/threonine-protein kinase
VSPQNIIVANNGSAKLVDFGVAKATSSSAHTTTGLIKGKVRYMPPEQAAGAAVDNRSDIYSVGIILWEIVARERYYGEMPNMAVFNQLMTGVPAKPVHAADRGLPAFTDEVVARALAPRPDDRYQHASEFCQDLAKLAGMLGGFPSSAEVSSVMVQGFADRERRLEKSIETCRGASTASLSAVGTDSPSVPRFQFSSVSSMGGLPQSPAKTSADDGTTVEPSMNSVSEASSATPSGVAASPGNARKRGSRLPVVVGALALSFVFAGGAGWFIARGEKPPAAAGSALAPTPSHAWVTLAVGATPSAAKIYLDAVELDSNPAVVVRPASAERHVLVFTAPGYEAKRSEVTLERDVVLNVTLRPISRTNVAVAPSAAPEASPRHREPSSIPRSAPVARGRPAKPASPPPAESTETSPPPRRVLDNREPW